MNTETIFQAYQPIECYLRLLDDAHVARPIFQIKGIDAFLLRQLAILYPSQATVLDLAGALTGGVSTVFWAAQTDAVAHTFAADLRRDLKFSWQTLAAEALGQLALSAAALTFVDAPQGVPDMLETLIGSFNRLSPLLVVLPLSESASDGVLDCIARLRMVRPDAIILLLPLGSVGESSILERLLALCGTQSAYRLYALREVSPFFAVSQLGLIVERTNLHIPAIFDRLHATFDGNFNYVALADQMVKLQLEAGSLQPIKLVGATVSAGATAAEGAAVSLPTQIAHAIVTRAVSFGRWLLRKPIVPSGVTYLQCAIPRKMRAGDVVEGMVEVRNDNRIPWRPAGSTSKGVNFSYHWYTQRGDLLVKEGTRSVLPNVVEPGQSVEINFNVTTPPEAGIFKLELDMLQEGIAWFSSLGNPGPAFEVTILP